MPVRPTQVTPFSFAARMASSTFRALPDVEMPSSMSPG